MKTTTRSTPESTLGTTFRHVTTAVVATAALVIAGCGASDAAAPQLPTATASPTTTGAGMGDPSDSSSGATTPVASSDPEEAQAQFDKCMADHGAKVGTFDDSVTGETSFTADAESNDNSDDNVAFEECQHFLDAAFGEFDNDPQQQAESADQNLAVAKCLQDAGWGDFTVDENGTLNGTIDPSKDPEELDAAMLKCDPSLPQP